MQRLTMAPVAAVCLALGGCGAEPPAGDDTGSAAVPAGVTDTSTAPVPDTAAAAQTAARRFGGVQLSMPPDVIIANPARNGDRQALFGDLHIHTTYSFDAFAFGTIATPDDAYRYAQGEAIRHPAGFDVQLRAPLDFYAVTDHAMFLGAVKAAADTESDFSDAAHVQGLHNLNAVENLTLESLPDRVKAFSTFLPDTLRGVADGSIDGEMLNDIARDAWSDIVAAADRHYKPGQFTTFVAYEYTSSTDGRGNLHRNVVFRDSDKLPAMPFSRFHSQDPEGLWDWMDDLRAQGMEALAIPHNANGSNGQMFKLVDWAGDPLDEAYAAKRLRNEPLVELTQVKGTSETHPLLSPNDEWAGFEIMPFRVATTLPSEPRGSYARDALRQGLSLATQGLTNAYQFGFVAASDTHTGAASLDEDDFFSKVGLLDSSGSLRGATPLDPGDAEILRSAGRVSVATIGGRDYATGAYETWSASGLTGVWAEDNDRDAIYRAFRRKETFATSGPRIRIRLFAGHDFDADIVRAENRFELAYANGVAMGSELVSDAEAPPGFLVWAARDAGSAALQRLQIVKGWARGGETFEKVYDVACSNDGTVDPATHRCPDNGAEVDLSDCSVTTGVGAGELASYWEDPDYQADEQAFYYARVLENPTCRWSTWDALRAGVTPRPDLPATIQERAWSSPIWTVPHKTR